MKRPRLSLVQHSRPAVPGGVARGVGGGRGRRSACQRRGVGPLAEAVRGEVHASGRENRAAAAAAAATVYTIDKAAAVECLCLAVARGRPEGQRSTPAPPSPRPPCPHARRGCLCWRWSGRGGTHTHGQARDASSPHCLSRPDQGRPAHRPLPACCCCCCCLASTTPTLGDFPASLLLALHQARHDSPLVC